MNFFWMVDRSEGIGIISGICGDIVISRIRDRTGSRRVHRISSNGSRRAKRSHSLPWGWVPISVSKEGISSVLHFFMRIVSSILHASPAIPGALPRIMSGWRDTAPGGEPMDHGMRGRWCIEGRVQPDTEPSFIYWGLGESGLANEIQG